MFRPHVLLQLLPFHVIVDHTLTICHENKPCFLICHRSYLWSKATRLFTTTKQHQPIACRCFLLHMWTLLLYWNHSFLTAKCPQSIEICNMYMQYVLLSYATALISWPKYRPIRKLHMATTHGALGTIWISYATKKRFVELIDCSMCYTQQIMDMYECPAKFDHAFYLSDYFQENFPYVKSMLL